MGAAAHVWRSLGAPSSAANSTSGTSGTPSIGTSATMKVESDEPAHHEPEVWQRAFGLYIATSVRDRDSNASELIPKPQPSNRIGFIKPQPSNPNHQTKKRR